MKLSMWTLYDYIVKHGFQAEAYIADGLPCISLLKESRTRSYTPEYAEIFENNGDVYVANDMDQIIVKNAEARDVANALGTAINAYSQWEHDLLECVLNNGTLQELLKIAQRIFNRPMFIKNDSTRTLAVTPGYPSDVHPYWDKIESSFLHGIPDYDLVREVSQDPEYRTAFLEKYPSIRMSPAYGGRVIHANVFVNERRVAEVVTLEHTTPFNNGDVHLMNVFSELIGKYVKNNTNVFQSGLDVTKFLINLIETGKLENEQYLAVNRYLGIEDGDEMCVMVAMGAGRIDSPILSALREKLEIQIKDAAIFQYEGQIVVIKLLKNLDYKDIVADFRRLIPKEGFHWAVSYEFPSLEFLPEFYKSTLEILEKAVFTSRNHVTMYDMVPNIISMLCNRVEMNRTLIHPDVLRLEKIDITENTEYCKTLLYYLLCGGNFTDAAAEMSLHRNTMIYRINKIREIIRSNLDDIQNRKRLLYSFLFIGKEHGGMERGRK